MEAATATATATATLLGNQPQNMEDGGGHGAVGETQPVMQESEPTTAIDEREQVATQREDGGQEQSENEMFHRVDGGMRDVPTSDFDSLTMPILSTKLSDEISGEETDGGIEVTVHEMPPPSPTTKDTAKEQERPKWSEVLRSPCRGTAFSPSMDINRSGNFHGLGLTSAVERAKSLSRCGKRCASLLVDIAGLSDVLALAVLKACQPLSTAPSATSSDGSSISVPGSSFYFDPVQEIADAVRRCLVSFAKQTQGLSICIRGSVARPLQDSATASGDATPAIFSRYASARSQCSAARQSALRARSHYQRAVRDAEAAIRDLHRARVVAVATDISNIAPPSKAKISDSSSESKVDDQPALTDPPKTPKRDTGDSAPPSSTKGLRTPLRSINTNIGVEAPLTPVTPSNRKNLSVEEWVGVVRSIGTSNGIPKAADRVVRCLQDAQDAEEQYSDLVDKENRAVSRAQTMEVMALESLQEVEEERLQFFLETLERYLQAEKGALDNMTWKLEKEESDALKSSSQNAKDPDSNVTSSTASPPKADPRSRLLLSSSQHGEDEGAEGRSLDLPESVLKARDGSRRNLTRLLQGTQAVKTLVVMSEEIAGAMQTFSNTLLARLAAEGYASQRYQANKTGDTLYSVLKESESVKVLHFWNKVVGVIMDCSASAAKLAERLRADCHTRLDRFVLSGEKDCKLAIEREDKGWRAVCEASRNMMKAKSKLIQSATELERAKEKMSATETEASEGETASDQSNINPAMRKALGNMFSILPAGGEEAMTKMFNAKDRRAIVKASLDEAQTKEARDKQALIEARTVRDRRVSSYLSSSETLGESLSSKDDELWTVVSGALEGIVTVFSSYHTGRLNRVIEVADKLGSHSRPAIVLSAIQDWTAATEERMTKQIEKSEKEQVASSHEKQLKGAKHPFSPKTETGDESFLLQKHLEDSNRVRKLLRQLTADGDGGAEECDEDEGYVPLSPRPVTHPMSLGEEEQTSRGEQAQTPVRSPAMSDGGGLLGAQQHLDSVSDSVNDALEEGKKLITSLTSALGEAGETLDSVSQIKTTKQEVETEVFMAHFWDAVGTDQEESSSPSVIESYSCAYWPKEGEGYIAPLLHGRLFATSNAMYFVGWGDKKIVLKWEHVMNVTKETTMMGTVDNAIKVAYDRGEGADSYFFGTFAFRDNAFELMNRLSVVARSLHEINKKDGPDANGTKRRPVPPDTILKKMEPVLTKKLQNVSVKQFYEACWSEGNRTSAKPFYGPWLEEEGSHEVKVEDWQFADEGEGFKHEWSGESHTQKRIVTFKYKRTTHLYIGPPVADVKQTHYCYLEGDDKFVLSITVEMDGVPYADTFAVEVRWVARRVEALDLSVEVGVLVNFKKSSMFAKQIRQGTVTETKPVHERLFAAIKRACGTEGGEGEGVGTTSENNNADDEAQGAADRSVVAKSTSKGGSRWKTRDLVVMSVILLFLLFLWRRFLGAPSGASDDVRSSHLELEDVEFLRSELEDGDSLRSEGEDVSTLRLELEDVKRQLKRVTADLNELRLQMKDVLADRNANY